MRIHPRPASEKRENNQLMSFISPGFTETCKKQITSHEQVQRYFFIRLPVAVIQDYLR